ncbi:hypothetical protein BOC42_14745 [Burkholderia pseudomallei]|nr:hypothetical protein BOC36_14170 [Burkholderia pseudomallei]ARK88468.1 hypothetical protein BOC42_14745 [Burkholderia pseudomallei]ARL00577.1 hypothetical protein BOC44_01240 [Burkholderia pseudomallei]ARL35759.1 hypothetical protein BOC49_05380 [Burkholderia pseudomallei]ARM00709.1 hypothetical protein BOC59_12210 [Burkholderia pseudomallei]
MTERIRRARPLGSSRTPVHADEPYRHASGGESRNFNGERRFARKRRAEMRHAPKQVRKA